MPVSSAVASRSAEMCRVTEMIVLSLWRTCARKAGHHAGRQHAYAGHERGHAPGGRWLGRPGHVAELLDLRHQPLALSRRQNFGLAPQVHQLRGAVAQQSFRRGIAVEQLVLRDSWPQLRAPPSRAVRASPCRWPLAPAPHARRAPPAGLPRRRKPPCPPRRPGSQEIAIGKRVARGPARRRRRASGGKEAESAKAARCRSGPHRWAFAAHIPALFPGSPAARSSALPFPLFADFGPEPLCCQLQAFSCPGPSSPCTALPQCAVPNSLRPALRFIDRSYRRIVASCT